MFFCRLFTLYPLSVSCTCSYAETHTSLEVVVCSGGSLSICEDGRLQGDELEFPQACLKGKGEGMWGGGLGRSSVAAPNSLSSRPLCRLNPHLLNLHRG